MKTNCDLITDYLKLVEKEVSVQLFSTDPQVDSLVRHVVESGGKMLRPKLFLLSSLTGSQICKNHIEIAAILEMIHTATLLHDDVIDNAGLRRSSETLNSLYGNERAVLMGDYVLSKAFSLSSRLERTDIQLLLSEMTSRICRGEITQDFNRDNFSLGRSAYLRIISDKTACFFETACRLGAVYDNREDFQQALGEYGLNVGIAFQIRDDILDIFGTEQAEGKTLGTDANNAKPTLSMIHFLETADISQREKFHADMGREQLAELLEQSGSVEHSVCTLKTYCENAIFSLNRLPDSSAKDSLKDIADSLAKINL